MKVKGTYHCQTTQQPNTLNGWDIRSVSVDLPEEEDKPYRHKVTVAVVVINGKEVEVKDLPDAELFAEKLNRKALTARNYTEEKTA